MLINVQNSISKDIISTLGILAYHNYPSHPKSTLSISKIQAVFLSTSINSKAPNRRFLSEKPPSSDPPAQNPDQPEDPKMNINVNLSQEQYKIIKNTDKLPNL